MHTVVTTILVCGTLFLLCIAYLSNKFSKERGKYHIRAIKLYLHYKFTAKILQRLQQLDMYNNIIHDVKEFFLLEEVEVLRVDDQFSGDNHIDIQVVKHIKNNLQHILSTLASQQYVLFTINTDESRKDVIIQYLNTEDKLLIVYSTNIENKLSKDEIEMMTSIVIPIVNLAMK